MAYQDRPLVITDSQENILSPGPEIHSILLLYYMYLLSLQYGINVLRVWYSHSRVELMTLSNDSTSE
jgi:hypothetical protein